MALSLLIVDAHTNCLGRGVLRPLEKTLHTLPLVGVTLKCHNNSTFPSKLHIEKFLVFAVPYAFVSVPDDYTSTTLLRQIKAIGIQKN